MKKYNVYFPIAGVLNFMDVEANSEQEAIESCYRLVDESEDPIREFDAEWEMYRKLMEGNAVRVSHNEVIVEKSEVD